MTDKRDPKLAPFRKEGAGRGAKRPAQGLDERWLERKVRDMYQEVVNEPIPDELLKILNRMPKPGT
jgi:hypothetical protein